MTVTFIHGFTQTRQSWAPVLGYSKLGDFLCIDAPGHGTRPATDDDLWAVAHSLAGELDRGPLVGYSMGGRIALHIALAHPDKVSRLVLISTTPGIEDERERATRRDSDEALATRLEELGVEAFIDEWMSGPLFRSYAPTETDMASRRSNTVAGLASSLRHQGTGTQDDLWPRLTGLVMPVLLIVGGADTKFLAINRRMASLIGDVELVEVAGAGHAVHLERPQLVAELIDEFVSA